MYGGYSSLPGIEYYNPVAMLKEMKRIGSQTTMDRMYGQLKLAQGLSWSNFLSHEGSNWKKPHTERAIILVGLEETVKQR
jgi:hypothetical protein